jgi:hypothetical protein
VLVSRSVEDDIAISRFRAPRSGAVDRLTRSLWTGPVIALVVSCAFIAWRWIALENGDITKNIIVGRILAPGHVGHGIAVISGGGYDGQFYYRFALDPFKLNGLVDGIGVDSPIRIQRIGYPFLVWLLSGGHAGAVPYLLVVVNIASFVALAALGGLLARSHGRRPLWGGRATFLPRTTTCRPILTRTTRRCRDQRPLRHCRDGCAIRTRTPSSFCSRPARWWCCSSSLLQPFGRCRRS